MTAARSEGTAEGRAYYPCRGRTDKLRRAAGRTCTTRYPPAQQLDAVVWRDLCAVLTEPVAIAAALERAHSGQWLPQEVQARCTTVEQGLAGIERQQPRLLAAYLGEVIELTEFERKRHELERRRTDLAAQLRQLEALTNQQLELARMADSIDAFCAQVRAGLEHATFAQKRALVELLIDCVIVTNEVVEIRYVIPTTRAGPRQRFCHLRIDYRERLQGYQTGRLALGANQDARSRTRHTDVVGDRRSHTLGRQCRWSGRRHVVG